jgi:hypothetical protein
MFRKTAVLIFINALVMLAPPRLAGGWPTCREM